VNPFDLQESLRQFTASRLFTMKQNAFAMTTFIIAKNQLAFLIVKSFRNLNKTHLLSGAYETIKFLKKVRKTLRNTNIYQSDPLGNSIPPSFHDESSQSHDVHF
jgi:hypothetical protein